LEKLFEEGTVSGHEFTYLKKDGELLDVEINSALLKDSKGNVTGSVASIRDITERKLTEREVIKTKEYLDNVIESSLDPIVITDNKGYLVRANKSFLKLLGCEEEEAKGKHIAEFSPLKEGNYESTTGELVEINEEFFNNIKTWMSRLVEERKATNLYSYLIGNDNKLIPVEENIVYFLSEEGDVAGAVGIIRDITEREKIEKETRDAKEFLESVIKSSRDGILITDENGYIQSLNVAMEEMSGYKREELLGEHTSIFAPDDESMVEVIMEKTAEMYEKGFSFYESKLKNKCGETIDVECSSSMIKEDKENNIGAVSIIRNTTDRKEMEKRLFQSEKLKSLGELSGGVAHDFNNILAAILGRVQLLKIQIKPPFGKQEKRKSILDLKAGLEVIEKASLDGAETVRRIQEFSKRKAEDIDFAQVDINELVDNALEFTRVRWKNEAESKGIRIKIQKEFSPLTLLRGNPSELREVFTNLINNAIDAIPQGGKIRIKTFIDNDHVVIKIGDTGNGIPKNVIDRIVDPFFTTKGVQSTGLGLSVSYGIINRHQGVITVDSVEDEGTTFTIRLPLSDKEGAKESREKKVVSKTRKQEKANILVIEDEEDVRQLLRDILTDVGHDVETADNGGQGLKLFKRKDFDLVLTDLGMPGISGWQVAEGIKEINSKTPVALITGWGVELEDYKLRSKVDFIVNKPFRVDQVLELIQKGMKLRKKSIRLAQDVRRKKSSKH
jgi:PAS domain S-box-containing protein